MPPSPTASEARRMAAAAAGFFVNTVVFAASVYAGSFYDKTPYHTSSLTGEMWVAELMSGHPERIKAELGMRLHVFLALVEALSAVGLRASRHISLEQHVAIFLYVCVTGLSIRHVGERFQHANATISQYVFEALLMVNILIHPLPLDLFVQSYMQYLHLHSTPHTFDFQPFMTLSHPKLRTTPSFSHSSRMP